MRTRLLSVAAVALALVGLGASLASLIDYLGPTPTFCAETGCATVRATVWAHPLGIPMPVFGIAFYGLALALGFVARPRLRRYVAIAGAAWALGLVALQAFVIGAWCKLCLVADPAAIAYALVVLAGAGTLAISRRALLAVPGLAAIVIGLGLWTHVPAAAPLPPGTPACVTAAQVADRVTVVEFVDFECPFCRQMQERLAEAIAHRDVHLVRKMVPLAQHAGALPAALAWCCADAQGKGDAMAAALFAADPAQLTTLGCEELAARAGVDLARYRAALADPAIRAHLDADLADAKDAHVRALPTIFIGGDRVEGASRTTAQLVASLDRAAASVR